MTYCLNPAARWKVGTKHSVQIKIEGKSSNTASRLVCLLTALNCWKTILWLPIYKVVKRDILYFWITMDILVGHINWRIMNALWDTRKILCHICVCPLRQSKITLCPLVDQMVKAIFNVMTNSDRWKTLWNSSFSLAVAL